MTIKKEYELVFEKNLDAILIHLKDSANGIRIDEIKNINVIGNVSILIDQLTANKYIIISKDEQCISITKEGKNFINDAGGYTQSAINKKREGKKKNFFTIGLLGKIVGNFF